MQKKANASCAQFISLLITVKLANDKFYLLGSVVSQCIEQRWATYF